MSSRFSYHNSPSLIDMDLMIPDKPTTGPHKLKRQTNEWTSYFGDYPSACAEIINGRFKGTHVLEVPVNSNALLLHPTRKEVKEVQCDVRDKVQHIYSQLELFAENGIITWKKETGGAEIRYRDETATLHFKLCEKTSMFHVAIDASENFASFIYCLRMIFITPGFFVTFEFDLTQEDVDRASVVTHERCIVPLKEENPEWMTDENADWNP